MTVVIYGHPPFVYEVAREFPIVARVEGCVYAVCRCRTYHAEIVVEDPRNGDRVAMRWFPDEPTAKAWVRIDTAMRALKQETVH